MADYGIRPYTNAKFVELLPTRATISNTQFRKNVMFDIMEAFGITLASAATHYNHAFIECKKASPALVEGLGRADDKKGGRKPKLTAAEVTGEVFVDAESVVQETFTVCKKKDGKVIAHTLSFEAAKAMVSEPQLRVNGQFVGKLYWK